MDLESILWGSEDSKFIWEILLRTSVMFFTILIFLKVVGKRGVKQLSVFELVIIIGLGSAAGDPMIYKEVGVASAIIAFLSILICYKILTIIVFHNKKIEELVEGKPTYIVKHGQFAIENFQKDSLSKDEFFMEMRLGGVYHLGQIEYAILEITGDLTIYFYTNQDIKYGLPILPHTAIKITATPLLNHYYSCFFCGHTIKIESHEICKCQRCQKSEWVQSSNRQKNKI